MKRSSTRRPTTAPEAGMYLLSKPRWLFSAWLEYHQNYFYPSYSALIRVMIVCALLGLLKGCCSHDRQTSLGYFTGVLKRTEPILALPVPLLRARARRLSSACARKHVFQFHGTSFIVTMMISHLQQHDYSTFPLEATGTKLMRECFLSERAVKQTSCSHSLQGRGCPGRPPLVR